MKTLQNAVGIELYSAFSQNQDLGQTALKMYGATQAEQLSVEALRELNHIIKLFNLAILSPNDAREVELDLTIKLASKKYHIYLGMFGDLDISMNVFDLSELLHKFNIGTFTYFLGCIYAGIVKRAFELEASELEIRQSIADAIYEQMNFHDLFGLYNFFELWRTQHDEPHGHVLKHIFRIYRKQNIKSKPSRIMIEQALCPHLYKSRLAFIANVSWAMLMRHLQLGFGLR